MALIGDLIEDETRVWIGELASTIMRLEHENETLRRARDRYRKTVEHHRLRAAREKTSVR